VGSTVQSVQGPQANAAPSAPAVPSPPPKPVAAPDAPQAPGRSPAKVTLPPKAPPGNATPPQITTPRSSASPAPASNAVTPSGKKVGAAAGSAVGGAPAALTQGPAADEGGATGPATRTSPAIRAADEVSVQRWFAYIWPAIALDGGAGDAGDAIERSWPAGVIAAELFRPVVNGVTRFLSAVGAATRAADGSPLVRRPAAGARQPALPETPAPAGGGLAYFVLLAALLAVLAYTIWTEFRTALRTRLH
jgi:hypothetical protein